MAHEERQTLARSKHHLLRNSIHYLLDFFCILSYPPQNDDDDDDDDDDDHDNDNNT
jgi:hypothetical protein